MLIIELHGFTEEPGKAREEIARFRKNIKGTKLEEEECKIVISNSIVFDHDYCTGHFARVYTMPGNIYLKAAIDQLHKMGLEPHVIFLAGYRPSD